MCLVAAEREAARVIVENLQRSGLYSGWKFEMCFDAEDLERWGHENIDVLVLSRFLPGAEPVELLRRLRLLFPGTHIVLLAGTESEKQRAYIKAARELGYRSIVTGKLPGDRPYTIFEALKGPMEDPSLLEEPVPVLEEEEEEGIPEREEAPEGEKVPGKEESSLGNPVNPVGTDSVASIKAAAEKMLEASPEELKEKLLEILAMLNAGGSFRRMEQVAESRSRKGVLVLSAANKGGVGKTTVAVTLGIALSRAGVPTVLVDYDFGGPDIANFFGIKNVPGIEVLAGKPVRKNAIRDIIVSRDGLDILPGPMDKTIPPFKPGQVLEITEALLEMYPVVIGDTPPELSEFSKKPWLGEIFSRADYVLAVVDQSVFSEKDTMKYAPLLLAMGVTPEKIGIVLNKYSPKLHSPRTVEKYFCAGFRKEVKVLPRIVAIIPEDWDMHVLKGYKGEAVGLDDPRSQWHRLAEKIAGMAGYGYRKDFGDKKGTLKGLFGKLRKIR